ncbi:MAG TPA: methyltransferase [Prolixibacteraceae bacterium]|nr:methyltransferase [Prolixibacteraceae bacterium]
MAHNNYFEFKQFTVKQNNAAMKVGTDGVLLGAWTNVENAKHILDIGTGTGVVALMLAQRSQANIVAIDCESSACIDARLNVLNSPWSQRIAVQEICLQEFAATTTQQFDCIVCNPPFFSNAVKPNDVKRSMARHNHSLPFDELLKSAALLLTPNGHFTVVLPANAENSFRMLASNYRLFPSRITRIKPKPSASISRVLLEFRNEATLNLETELTIETEKHHEYQPETIALLRDFYLSL